LVGGADVRDFEHQVLRAKVFLGAGSDRQAYMNYGVHSLARYDHVEGFIIGGHLVEIEVHLA
jgi:hypothetical protein